MYGGLYVQQLIPNTRDSGDTIHRDRRTLWLMHSPQGSLRLGYLSKINNEQLQSSPLKSTDQDNENSISNAIDEVRLCFNSLNFDPRTITHFITSFLIIQLLDKHFAY